MLTMPAEHVRPDERSAPAAARTEPEGPGLWLGHNPGSCLAPAGRPPPARSCTSTAARHVAPAWDEDRASRRERHDCRFLPRGRANPGPTVLLLRKGRSDAS